MKYSVKTKLTLWYVICFISAVVLMIVITSSVRVAQTRETLSDMLTSVVDSAAEESENTGSFINAYDEDIPYLRDNILISVYDADFQQLGGYSPGTMEDADFEDGSVRDAVLSDGSWLVYDKQVYIEGYGDIWIKGCVSVTKALTETQTLINIELIIFPIIIAIAVIGGILIATRAFRPIRDITKTANDIASGNDLSKRIPEQKQKDEISALTDTFNNMFSRLEKSFLNEKRFSDDVSHELKTPLAVIINTAEYAVQDEDEQKEALEIIIKQAKEMNVLVNKLLMLARAENGKITPSKEVFDLSELLSVIAEQTRDSASLRNMSVNFEADENILINADEPMVLSMIMNITENAVKYGKENGNIDISAKKEKDGAYITISNDGPHIKKENIDRIWQRFFREDESRSTKGTGLGLPIAKWIAEMHGGDITVTSEENKKTVFKIFIPF